MDKPKTITDGKKAPQVDEKKTQSAVKYKPVNIHKALSLRINEGMSYAHIGKILGHPKQSIQKALKKFKPLLKAPVQTSAYQENKAKLLTAAEFTLLSEIVDPDKLKKASVNNVAYAFQAVAKENHIARGEATENIQYYQLDEKESAVEADIERLEKELSGA